MVRAGSFRAAGEALLLSQPSVSAQVRSLERAVGLQLLLRSTRGATLTDAGAELLPHLRALLRAEAAAHQHAAALVGHRTGLVRVAGVNSAVVGLLPEAMRNVSAVYPDLDVEIAELTSAAVVEGVFDGTYEIGVCAELTGPSSRREIVAETLAEGPLMLVARHDDPVLQAPAIDRDTVASEPLVTLGPGYSLRRYALDYLAGYSPRIVSEALNHDTVRRLVAGGLGVTIMPKMTFETISDANGLLAARPLTDSELRVRLLLVHPGGESTPATRALVSAIRDVATQRFGPLP